MSEIFDFLKKTEAERRKRETVPEPAFDAPLAKPIEEQPAINLPEQAALSADAVEMEISTSERFDLTQASAQIRSVLDPVTMVGEQFRLLRSRLALMQKQRGIKTILITSTVPEEGKTFTACGLVGVFAQEPGRRVLLIDADMRKPKSGINFGLNGTAEKMGLSELLRGNIQFENAVLRSSNTDFCFMPSGPLPSNPSELLSSDVLERTLKAAAENFDWVILDSPPVLSLSDTTLLAPVCDAVILVVRANSTPSKLVMEAVNRIGRDRICGVVVNRQKQMHSSRYYYQYYYRNSKRQEK